MRQNQPVPCPCPQIDQLRAELLQERSSRQDLECDKVSLERQVRLSRGGDGSGPRPRGRPEGGWTPCPMGDGAQRVLGRPRSSLEYPRERDPVPTELFLL